MAIDRTGLRQTPTGWAVYVRVRPLPPVCQRFPKDTPLRVLVAWRDAQRAALRTRRNDAARQAPTAGTFAADAVRYLEAVAGMPTIVDRTWQIQKWVTRFGPWHRRAITSADIRTALAAWQAEGYSARTLNHFRTALMHLWHTLDGKGAANPVRDVPQARPPDALPRDRDAAQLETLLGRIRPSKARAVLRLMRTTGMTPTEIGRIEPGDVREADGVLVARGRRKGKGSRPRALPLTPAAREALAEFRQQDAWGGVSLGTLWAAFDRAKRNTGLADQPWTVYDLRHTYLTEMAAEGDDRAVQYLAGHSTTKMTERYTLGSVPARVASVIASVIAKGSVHGGQPQRIPEKPAPAPITPHAPESGENRPGSPRRRGERSG
jgi:integrase